MVKNEKKLNLVLSRIEDAEKWRDSYYKDNWKRYLNLYRSQSLEKREGANIFVPYIFMNCEVIRARISESLFSSRPYVTVLPRRLGDEEKATAAQTLLDWQFTDRMKIEGLFRKDILEILTTMGTAITYTGWAKKTRKVRSQKKEEQALLDQSGQPIIDDYGNPLSIPVSVVVEEDSIIYDDPECVSIDLFDFFVDPTATTIYNARYCGHREYRTKAELRELEKTAGYKINWKDLEPANDITDGRQTRMQEEGKNIPSDNYSTKDKNGFYEVLQYWEDERHCVIINRQQLVLDEGNPFWHGMKPYDKVVYTPLANSFYGMGIPQLLESLQSELNALRNQRIDYNSMSIRRMWKVREGCGLEPKDLVWRQNGILQVANMDDVQEIMVSDISPTAFNNEAVAKQDMRDATGCHDIIMGLAESNETATTTMTKDNNASLRFKDVVNNVVEDMLVPIAVKCIALDQQFMSDERAVRILDQNAANIIMVSPDDIAGEYDVIYVGSSVDPMANKEAKQQRMVNIYNMLAGDPLYQQDNEARRKLMESLLKAYDVDNIEGILPQIPQQEAANGQEIQMGTMAQLAANGVL